MDDFEPIAIADIGDSYLRLNNARLYPAFVVLPEMKNNEHMLEQLYEDRDY